QILIANRRTLAAGLDCMRQAPSGPASSCRAPAGAAPQNAGGKHGRSVVCPRRTGNPRAAASGQAAALPSHHGGNPVSHAGPSPAAAELYLAGIRSGAEIPRPEPVPRLLGKPAGRQAAFGAGGVGPAGQPGGIPRRRCQLRPALGRTPSRPACRRWSRQADMLGCAAIPPLPELSMSLIQYLHDSADLIRLAATPETAAQVDAAIGRIAAALK